MRPVVLSAALLSLAVLMAVGCSGDDPPADPPVTDTTQQRPLAAPADPVAAPPVGRPTGSGYADTKILVQLRPTGLRENHSPSDGHQYLLVLLSVDSVDGAGTFVPADYKVEINGKRYVPKAVGFGQPHGIFALVKELIDEQVQVEPGPQDQPQHDGRYIRKAVLKNPQIVLVYDVPPAAAPVLRHGEQSFPLSPDLAALTPRLDSKTVAALKNTSVVTRPSDLPEPTVSTKFVEAKRVQMEITGEERDAMAVTVEITADRPTDVTINRSEIGLVTPFNPAGGGGGVVFFDFAGIEHRLLAGTVQQEGERHDGEPIVGIENGGAVVSVGSEPVRLRMFFLNPPKAGDLALRFPGEGTLPLAVANPLGKFPEPETRLPEYIAHAPIVGEPLQAAYIGQAVPIAANAASPDQTAMKEPGGGQRWLAVRFRLDGQDGKPFVLNDYNLFTEGFVRFQPRAVDFGGSPQRFVRPPGFAELDLMIGAAEAPVIERGEIQGWTLSRPEVTLLYEVPDEPRFIFVHGSTQFVLEDIPLVPGL